MDVRTWIRSNHLLLDGAMGTLLQHAGLEPGTPPEMMNLTHPSKVTEIHREYVAAGSDAVTANTFGVNALRFPEHGMVEKLVSTAIHNARVSGARFVALDAGPLGQMLEPLGSISFEKAYSLFKQVMIAGERAGADFVIIETMSDLYEVRAAVLAAKENTSLPIFCTMTFAADGRTFVGCDALTAVISLQALGVDALGVNCSVGPDKLGGIIDTMLRYSRVPVIVQANAGIPRVENDKTVYDVSPAKFAGYTASFMLRGVRIMGGCCGTTPETISLIRRAIDGEAPVTVWPELVTACTSGSKTVVLDYGITVIGERINPTGKKKLAEALRKNDIDYVVNEAIDQQNAGANVLDINVGLPDINEAAMLAKVVREVQGIVTVPLQLDSLNPRAIEAALRITNGKPIINSVNGNRATMDAIFPLAKKYGALVIGLTMDDKGIPQTPEGRYAIARRILDSAIMHGLSPEDLLIDCLVLTASAQQQDVMVALKTIKMIKQKMFLKTVLGVSNVSYGLPERDMLGSTFLAAALGAGLDAPILNPMSRRYAEVIDSFRVLNAEDRDSAAYIRKYSSEAPAPSRNEEPDSLMKMIIEGRRADASAAASKLLENISSTQLVDGHIIPALDEVGRRYERGTLFLPQLTRAADAVEGAFEVLRGSQKKSNTVAGKKILLATVEGDVHDIGKNIVKMILESYGYEITDLGKDVPAEEIVRVAREGSFRLVGLSALMTTTVMGIKKTIDLARKSGLHCSFMVGGAVLNEQYAQMVGAEFYAPDAISAAEVANRFFNK